MKKPGKAKPKKRARKPGQATAHVQPTASENRSGAVTAKAARPTAKPSGAKQAEPRRRETKHVAAGALETKQVAAPLIAITVPPTAAKAAPAKVTPSRKAARKGARAQKPFAAVPIAPQRPAPARMLSRAAIPYWAREEQAALALLIAPLLVVSIWIGIGQGRRSPVPALPEYAASPVTAPPLTAPSLTAPSLTAPGPIVYPPALPDITVARLDQRPTAITPPVAIAPRPVDVVVPGARPAYPTTAPEIPLPTMAALSPAPPQSAPMPVAHVEPTYPPPQATFEVAVRPVAPVIAGPMAPPPLPTTQADAADISCRPSGTQLASFSSIGRLARAPRQPLLTGVDPDTFGRRLSEAAVAQSRDLVIYTARYQPMAYPLGDVVALHGACIDVVIRAYRALGIDLQEEVQKARGRRGDPNIDHRRTENMRRFLESKGASLPITSYPEDYKPGDIVTYHRPFSRVSTSHIAIVTDILAPTGRPMIVHNRGYGAQLEDALFVDRITGHYRYHGPPSATVRQEATGSATAHGAPVVRASLPRQGRTAAGQDTGEVRPEPASGPRPK